MSYFDNDELNDFSTDKPLVDIKIEKVSGYMEDGRVQEYYTVIIGDVASFNAFRKDLEILKKVIDFALIDRKENINEIR